MNNISWGLLGPETLPSERRTRTLGISAAVRVFNDLSVPGLGGVKFSKNIFLACLGVHVAELSRAKGQDVTNIQVTNSIEALACLISFNRNGGASDERLRGSTKLQGKSDLSYNVVSKREFYVTQPMRMATTQTLLGLGLVNAKGERFNSFSLNEYGLSIVKAGCDGFQCHQNNIVSYLVKWVEGDSRNPDQDSLYQSISPLEALTPDAKRILKERFISGRDDFSERRKCALGWVSAIDDNPCLSWASKPDLLSSAHWNDIKSGAHFFMLRDDVMALLNSIETLLANSGSGKFNLADEASSSLQQLLEKVKFSADKFLSLDHDPTPNQLANQFARECLQSTDMAILKSLVTRDNQVLKIRGSQIIKGPAFAGEQPSPEISDPEERRFPLGVSYRLHNLYVLNLDFENKLDSWFMKDGDNHE